MEKWEQERVERAMARTGFRQFEDVFNEWKLQDRANWILRDTRFTADDEGVAHDICPDCGECQIDHSGGIADPLRAREVHTADCTAEVVA